MKVLYITILYCLYSLFSLPLNAQCYFPLEFEIEDQATVTIPFDITGAVNNDLSSPTQCVAEVSIDFEHSVIGDLLINLISPAGQVVTLIGPVGPSGSTQFITWDISFVPCATIPAPHPLLDPVWNNLQNWATFTAYNGSYHPFSGCLEDFNTGPVNGTWNLQITDAQQFDVGIIHSITLTFCDGTGLNCNLCEPDAGTLPDTTIYICEGSNYILQDVIPNYSGPAPHPALYDYTFLLSLDDTLLQVNKNLNLNGYPAGNYNVFGLSYLMSGIGSLPMPNGELTIDSLGHLLNGQSPPFCGEISNYFELEILAPDTLRINETICNNIPVIIDGIQYSSAGSYVETFENIRGCDSIIMIQIEEQDAQINIVNPIDLDCDIPSVLIDASSSITGPNGIFSWNTINGNILSSLDSNIIYVNQEGTYFLTLQNGDCVATQSVEVSGNAPIVFEPIEDTFYLDCVEHTVIIDALEGSAYNDLEWNGPGLFSSIEQLPLVSEAGTYQLTIFQGDSCQKSLNFYVLEDTLSATIYLSGDNFLNCSRDSTWIYANANKEVNNFTWIDPDSVIFIGDSLWTGKVGSHKIITETPEGCISERYFTVFSDKTPPEVILIGDTLTCKVTKVGLNIEVIGNISKYEWSGPDSFASTEMAPVIDEAGWYYITVTGNNWCVTNDSLFISLDTLKPLTHTVDTSLSCIDSSINLVVQSDPPAFAVNWHGPNGFQSFDFNPLVSDTGTYYVFVESENGCFSLDSLLINYDPRKPIISIDEPLPLSCSADSVLLIVQSDVNSSFIWYDAQGIAYSNQEYYAKDTGLYFVQAIFNANGCFAWDSVEVIRIENGPIAQIESNLPYQCPNQIITLAAQGNIDNTILGFSWSTEDGHILSGSDRQHMLSNEEGTYFLEVIDFTTGCITKDTLILLGESPYNIDMDVNLVSPTCLEFNNGEITIEQVYGGYSPYTYSMDGIYFNNKIHYQYLDTGSYFIVVKDSLGCQDTTAVQLNAEGGISITLPESIEIMLGEAALLAPILSTHEDSVSISKWTPSEYIYCPDCIVTEANPNLTTSFEISITDNKGCHTTEDIEVIVNREKDIYVPNAFSVNNDGNNEILYVISTQAVEEIEQFSIFNRWGNLVFENRVFPPNIESEGWDGRFKGQELTPQVFVYMIKYRLVDGSIKIKHGDITLIR
jgi:gliding motility-associated-like protein